MCLVGGESDTVEPDKKDRFHQYKVGIPRLVSFFIVSVSLRRWTFMTLKI